MIEYRNFQTEYMEQVKELFREEEWNAYLRDDKKLFRAFRNSLFLLGAFEGEKLIGFLRAVGDGEHILLVQDLIVRKSHRRQGIGKKLFQTVWDTFRGVRMFHVVTDMYDEADNRFYSSFGMKKIEEGQMVSYYRVE